MDERELDFSTRAAHAGSRTQVGDTFSTIPPIAASTTFTYESVADVHSALAPDGSGFAYARNANPTVRALEEAMESLEGAEDVVAFGSGMAAIQAAVTSFALRPGDSVVAARDLYGVTRSFFAMLQRFGISVEHTDVLNTDGAREVLQRSRARFLYLESIANPLLQVPDIATLTAVARGCGASVIVDNTFATPYLLRPLELGVDLVVHSATKYIAGHGDVVAGLVAGSKTRTAPVRSARTVQGGVLSPFEAWLTIRGLRTLPLRMERQCATARELAAWLRTQSWTEHVYYPGLPDNPGYGVASRQFGDRYGAMVALDLPGEEAEILRFIDALRLIIPGTSLGDVESLILYPALSSHRTLSPEARRSAGIGSGLVRLSVGLESARDLMEDLERAAEAAGFHGRVDIQSTFVSLPGERV